jgi:hypothetical protein
MNVYLHTIVAVLPMIAAYLAGKHWGRESFVEDIVGNLISKLVDDGFIRTVKDKDGELELVPISEVVAKSLRDAYKHV